MAINLENNDRIDLVSPKPLTKRIEVYQDCNKKLYKTRNQAVRALIERGLESECEKSPELRKAIEKSLGEDQG